MLVLVFFIAFLVAYASLYVVSLFSGEGSNPIAVLKTVCIVWPLAVVMNLLEVPGLFSMIIYTIVSMVSFMKILGFEPTPAFFAGLLYSVINYFLLILIFSLLM